MTAKLKLGEILCEALTAKLQSGMAARQAVINADFADACVLAPISSYNAGRVAELPAIPAIFVLEGPTRFTPEGTHGLHSETELLVYIFDQDTTGPALARRLQRQVRAIIECVWDDAPQEQLNALAPFAGQLSAYRVWPTRTVPGRVFQPEAKTEWRAFYTVVFTARQQEFN